MRSIIDIRITIFIDIWVNIARASNSSIIPGVDTWHVAIMSAAPAPHDQLLMFIMYIIHDNVLDRDQ